MKENISKKQLREFSLLVGIGFPLLIGWVLPMIIGHGFRSWTLFIGLPVLISGIVNARLLRYPYKAWMALGHALGWVNSHIILGIVFIIMVQPIALVMRACGYDPLKKKKITGDSYRETRKELKIDLKRIF